MKRDRGNISPSGIATLHFARTRRIGARGSWAVRTFSGRFWVVSPQKSVRGRSIFRPISTYACQISPDEPPAPIFRGLTLYSIYPQDANLALSSLHPKRDTSGPSVIIRGVCREMFRRWRWVADLCGGQPSSSTKSSFKQSANLPCIFSFFFSTLSSDEHRCHSPRSQMLRVATVLVLHMYHSV